MGDSSGDDISQKPRERVFQPWRIKIQHRGNDLGRHRGFNALFQKDPLPTPPIKSCSQGEHQLLGTGDTHDNRGARTIKRPTRNSLGQGKARF